MLHSQLCILNHIYFILFEILLMQFVVVSTKKAFIFHQDGKTALYWAVEKGNATMVRDILQCNPDTESATKVSFLTFELL